MARRKLNLHEQLKGLEAAIESPRTPPQLKESLKKRAEEIRNQLTESPQTPPRKGTSFPLSLLELCEDEEEEEDDESE